MNEQQTQRRAPALTVVGPYDDAESIAFRLHNETCPHCSARDDLLDLCHEGGRLMRVMFAACQEND